MDSMLYKSFIKACKPSREIDQARIINVFWEKTMGDVYCTPEYDSYQTKRIAIRNKENKYALLDQKLFCEIILPFVFEAEPEKDIKKISNEMDE